MGWKEGTEVAERSGKTGKESERKWFEFKQVA